MSRLSRFAIDSAIILIFSGLGLVFLKMAYNTAMVIYRSDVVLEWSYAMDMFTMSILTMFYVAVFFIFGTLTTTIFGVLLRHLSEK